LLLLLMLMLLLLLLLLLPFLAVGLPCKGLPHRSRGWLTVHACWYATWLECVKQDI
jgi:hypothetical protein